MSHLTPPVLPPAITIATGSEIRLEVPASPITRLPIEILAETLVRWAELDHDAPWIASLVSHLWRATVLSEPRAWSRIYLPLKGPSVELEDPEWCTEEDHDVRDRRRPLALWLERATLSPDLFLNIQINRIAPLATTLYAVLKQFTPHLPSLREFELSTASTLLADGILKTFWTCTPRLQRITIDCRAESKSLIEVIDDRNRVLPHLWATLAKAPSVSAVVLKGCLPPQQPLASASGSRLLSLSFHGPFRSDDFKDMMLSIGVCEALEELTITNANTSTSVPPVTLLALKVLRVHNSALLATHDILKSIHAPQLLTLDLGGRIPESVLESMRKESSGGQQSMREMLNIMETFGVALGSFSTRSPFIRHLTLDGVHVKDRFLITALKNLPYVVELCLRDSFISGLALGALSRVGPPHKDGVRSPTALKSPVLCPDLRRLSLDTCPLLTGKMVQDLVKARTSSSLITNLDIHRCKLVGEVDVVVVKELGPYAMRVEFTPLEE
ncbi:hypothetical protein JAAARDRAFT_202597 [Jaapia argillacea MUCL 33604]|uniref:F-box domain-containing protein n=1 Tax=Jaapia argillacea MUCL 33604 TaxID=933084 RepID=A0A067QKD2_9AGAM|nr:hypothetical protein JAAARDRAFT_202597 [Jaapia argillacea MUCL 33604]